MVPTPALSSECAVLFADLVGSTQLYERMGDTAAFALVDRCLAVMQEAVRAVGGQVVKITGDGILATFWDPDSAAETAVAVHRDVREIPLVANFSLGVRVGFHYGPVVESGHDIFGETVNIAARLAELASPGKAISSRETAEKLSEGWKPLLRMLPPRVVKGVSRPVHICELLCDKLEDVTAVGGLTEIASVGELRLYQGGRVWVLGRETRRLKLGRDADADVVIRDPQSSRRHCEVELRGDKFVLIDRSSNGTFINIEGEREFVLTREEVVLRGHGWLSFGNPRSQATDVVEFFCLY